MHIFEKQQFLPLVSIVMLKNSRNFDATSPRGVEAGKDVGFLRGRWGRETLESGRGEETDNIVPFNMKQPKSRTPSSRSEILCESCNSCEIVDNGKCTLGGMAHQNVHGGALHKIADPINPYLGHSAKKY